ncbi:hypothetical protein NDN08_002278 [Rhodosorus marinus]|uniref:BHLH domain-containing protein n=1 Tax=Rhodosorus marinus TaxID=101924 RepID=A0AAV8UW36_9RHOD|nr:hypothetical protein NDN08_002278 [Rhodosorus marinus]
MMSANFEKNMGSWSVASTDFLLENHLREEVGAGVDPSEQDVFFSVTNNVDGEMDNSLIVKNQFDFDLQWLSPPNFEEVISEENYDGKESTESPHPSWSNTWSDPEPFELSSSVSQDALQSGTVAMPASSSMMSLVSPRTNSNGAPNPKRRKSAHKEHSKKYRHNVGNKFRELSDLVSELDEAEEGGTLSKSQVLEHSINLVKEYKKHVSSLSVDLAMSSRKNLLEWVDGVVEKSSNLYDAVYSLMNLLCMKKSWKYAEVWMPTGDRINTTLQLKGGLLSATDNSLGQCLERFRSKSNQFTFQPGQGLIGRVYDTLRAESVQDPSGSHGFLRKEIALRHGVNSCFAVPVVVNGRCRAVVGFFDTEERMGDIESINLANNVANYIGSAYGAKVVKEARNTTKMENVEKSN